MIRNSSGEPFSCDFKTYRRCPSASHSSETFEAALILFKKAHRPLVLPSLKPFSPWPDRVVGHRKRGEECCCSTSVQSQKHRSDNSCNRLAIELMTTTSLRTFSRHFQEHKLATKPGHTLIAFLHLLKNRQTMKLVFPLSCDCNTSASWPAWPKKKNYAPSNPLINPKRT